MWHVVQLLHLVLPKNNLILKVENRNRIYLSVTHNVHATNIAGASQVSQSITHDAHLLSTKDLPFYSMFSK